MSTPLEPTEEQLRSVAKAFAEQWALNPSEHARAAWPVIRDMVLEAAAVACEELPSKFAFQDDQLPGLHRALCGDCAGEIRGLKGTTP